MREVVQLKVWREEDDGVKSQWYTVQNKTEVLDLELCSGDKMLIDGIGNLEILAVEYNEQKTGENPYRTLLITCGLITNENKII